MMMTQTATLCISELKTAIDTWEIKKDSKEGYQYLTSGVGLELSKKEFKKWGSNISTIYCHLGIHDKALLFIFSSQKDVRRITEDNSSVVPFRYTKAPIITSKSNKETLKSSVSAEEAMKRSFQWTFSSQKWCENLQKENRVVKYIQLDVQDFNELFEYVNTISFFFGITDEYQAIHGDTIELILYACSSSNTEIFTEASKSVSYIFAGISKPCPPFG